MKKVLYIIDDINYNSGAKKVTLLQMQEVQKRCDVFLLSLVSPNEELLFLQQDHVLGREIWMQTSIYATALKKVICNKEYTLVQKALRIIYACSLRCGLGDAFFENLIKKKMKSVLETFDTVIVMSEASKMRHIVSGLKKPRKIQWIHTDYARWSSYSEWSRAITCNDEALYSKYDAIVVLSEFCKRGMTERLPSLSGKMVVIPNLIDGDRILMLADEPCSFQIDRNILNFVTVARIDTEKCIDELLRIAKELQHQNVKFKWYIVGDGPEKKKLEKQQKELGLEEQIEFLGHLDNPYPVMSNCDTLVLLSKYEGTPVTVDEAMVLGLNIIAPLIGGIPEQVASYENSYLVENTSFDLKEISVKSKKVCVFDYQSKNREILNLIYSII